MGALDRLIDKVRANGTEPEAISIPPRWIEHLRATLVDRRHPWRSPSSYRDLPIIKVLPQQRSVAVIADGHAHLLWRLQFGFIDAAYQCRQSKRGAEISNRIRRHRTAYVTIQAVYPVDV